MKYPNKHREIVKKLFMGALIHEKSSLYQIVKDNESFYKEFFTESFGYTLEYVGGVYFLSGSDIGGNFPSSFLKVLCVLIYEIDLAGKQIYSVLYHDIHTIDSLNIWLEGSVQFGELVKDYRFGNASFNLRKLEEKGLIEKIAEDKLKFTPAIELFIHYYQKEIKNIFEERSKSDETRDTREFTNS